MWAASNTQAEEKRDVFRVDGLASGCAKQTGGGVRMVVAVVAVGSRGA